MNDDPRVFVGATAQYASGAYQQVLVQHEIVCSMSRRGDCWDNAVAESFIATSAARAELFEYLEVFYNAQRRHSALGTSAPSVRATAGLNSFQLCFSGNPSADTRMWIDNVVVSRERIGCLTNSIPPGPPIGITVR